MREIRTSGSVGGPSSSLWRYGEGLSRPEVSPASVPSLVVPRPAPRVVEADQRVRLPAIPSCPVRTRRLEDAGPFTFVAADALVLKVREGGRVVPVHVLVATGVNADGHREILGVQVTSSEDGAGWLAFFRDLTARGLTGVKLVTSDAGGVRSSV